MYQCCSPNTAEGHTFACHPWQAQRLEEEPVEKRQGRQLRAGFVLTPLVPVSATPRAWQRARSHQQCWSPPAEDREGIRLLPPSALRRLPSPSFKARSEVDLDILPTFSQASRQAGSSGKPFLRAHLGTNGNCSTGS